MKKRVKLVMLLLGMCSLLFLLEGKTQAASVTITENQTVNVGDQVTVSASVNAGAWNLSLSGAGQNKPLVGQTSVAANASSSASITFKAENVGTYVISLSGDMTDFSQDNAESVSKNCIITVVANSTNNNQGNNNNNSNNNNSNSSNNNNNNSNSGNNSNNNSNNSNNTTKSNIATLSNLGITPNDFKGFTPSKTSYDVTVPNSVSSISIYAYPAKGQEKKQTISGTGKKQLKEGNNAFSVKVVAEDGTKKTYTLNITREKADNEDKPEENDTNTVDDNTNTVEDNTTEENSANSAENEQTLGLSGLKIQGITLKPDFQKDIYEYTAKLIGDNKTVDIDAIAINDESKVEITGNEDLKEGENVITILVSDKEGENTVTYQITLQKSLVDEEEIAKDKEQQRQRKQRFIILSVLGVSIIAVIMILIIRYTCNKHKVYSGVYMPYQNDMDDNESISNDDFDEEYEEFEEKKRKKSKGKRFK